MISWLCLQLHVRNTEPALSINQTLLTRISLDSHTFALDFTQYGMRRQDYLNYVRGLLMRPLSIALIVIVIFLLPKDVMVPSGRYTDTYGYTGTEGIAYN